MKFCRLIPSLTLSMSNITCQFVATGSKDERSVMWMRASEEQLKSGVKAIKLENHEGMWIEKPDMWSKYIRRPDSLDEMCFAQFAKMYKGSASKEDNDDPEVDEDSEDEDDVVQDESIEKKFHYIMTHKDPICKGKKLPEMIKLDYPYPGERTTMKKRAYPAALRFHKVQKDNDHKRYMLHELMLYSPQRSELELDNVEKLFNEEYNGERKVQIVKSQVMEFLESVTEARYHVEQLEKEGKLNLNLVGEVIDPMGEQEDEDCENEGLEDHQDFLFCDPEFVKANAEKRSPTIYKQVAIPASDELRKKTESLD